MVEEGKNLPAKTSDIDVTKLVRKDSKKGENAKIAGKSAAKALLGSIPFAGPAIVEFLNGLDEVKQADKERVIKSMIEDHQVDISLLKEKLENDSELADIVARGMAAASAASFETKQKLLAGVLAGSIESDPVQRVYARILLRIIDFLDKEHVEILTTLRDWEYPSDDSIHKERQAHANVPHILSKLPHLEHVIGVLIKQLDSLDLIKNTLTGQVLFGGGELANFKLDNLGEKLIEYLETKTMPQLHE
ncbi:hypothetical protein [Amycolatopsis albispora]|uniref:hypothetical protein n=1 Tax=Amycolatopsis albispora TaxID=1804986 RepID=UPI0013B3FA89|nr:hypothetical protein [Amycolatopsis albispora]